MSGSSGGHDAFLTEQQRFSPASQGERRMTRLYPTVQIIDENHRWYPSFVIVHESWP